jgi:O-antigen ligase
MLVSVLWSEITFIALKRWVREGAVLIMALVLLSERDPRAALESLLRRSVYLLLPFSLLLIKYYPAMGVDYGRWSGLQMWIGVTVHKNCLGRLCLIASFFLLWALYRRWKHGEYPAWRYQTLADAFLLLMAFYLLKGPGNAYSATSVATLGVGIVAFLLLVHFRRRQILVSNAALLALIAFLIAFGAATPFLGGANVASFTGSLGRNETLTGRTDTWVELVPVVKSRPFLGSGFSSFWTSARRELYGMSHGHNGYLDTLLDIGGVGMCLYAVFLLSCGSRLHSILGREYDWASLGICFLLMSLVYNVSESALNSLGEQMTAMLILSVLVIPAPYCRSVPDGDIGVGGLADTIASSKT